jgi:DmsA/YnfE family anaerobic dimethyl sulfoxide reductase A subunit
MKRTGKRGEGEFEQITWDEAIGLIIEKLEYTIDAYGIESIFGYDDSGASSVVLITRLLNKLGGSVGWFGSYSVGQALEGGIFTFGPINSLVASPFREAAKADLLVMFGNNPSETSMSGSGTTHDLAWVRETGTKIVNIDYRLNDSSSGFPEEWIPIRSGTDAALASALCHVFITEGFADEDFLHKCCVGYDEQTMPESAPPNSSYKDYILGTGYDMIPKTPEWASPITQIPVERIYELARQIGNAEAAYICQGWGPQRHSNGEDTSRAITMVAIVSGNIGRSGTNTGNREFCVTVPTPGFSLGFPVGDNPVSTQIGLNMWVDAIDRGADLTSLHDGIRGRDKLETGIKFLYSRKTNWINQYGDVNRTHEVLSDEAKCEFILIFEVMMSPWAKYADLLLPDILPAETETTSDMLGFGYHKSIVFGQQVTAPKFECRSVYEVMAEVADGFGLKDYYTGGMTISEWTRAIYDSTQQTDPSLPSYEDGIAMGVFKEELPITAALTDFRLNPESAPLDTPSGKIEIFSPALFDIQKTWLFDDPKDAVSPIPIFTPGFEGYDAIDNDYPFILSGFHFKGRANSSLGNVDVLKQANRQSVWINPIDAESLSIENGDLTLVSTKRGMVEIEARVTPRVIPGCLALPQGAWCMATNENRTDKGGCINVLTSAHPSPLAKMNIVNTNIARIEKL